MAGAASATLSVEYTPAVLLPIARKSVLTLGVLLTFTGCLQPKKKNDASGTTENAVRASTEWGRAGDTPGTRVLSGEQLRERIAEQGRATLVNAWASWCGPCREEYPMLEKMRAGLKAKGIELVFVSVDDADSQQKAVSFAKENGSPSPLLVAEQPLGPFKQALYENWKGVLPSSFLFDKSGNLVHFWGGPVEEGDVTPVVTKFLAGEALPVETNFGLIPGRDMRGE
jgi:thiol-disulfide isomerase/thioredoxin